jgi:hypothetical protein
LAEVEAKGLQAALFFVCIATPRVSDAFLRPNPVLFHAKGNFNTIYAASSLATAIAETIIRDRFEGDSVRFLARRRVRFFTRPR